MLKKQVASIDKIEHIESPLTSIYCKLKVMQVIFYISLYVRVELIIIYLIAFQRGESVIGTVDEPSSEDVKREGLAGME